MRGRLDAVLATLGEPRAVDVEPFARSRRYENWRVSLEDGSARLLRVARDVRSHRGLLHEAAAHEVLKSTELPVVRSYRLLDPEAFGAPASLSSWLPGLAGQGVMDAYPEALPGICEVLGMLRRAMEDQTSGAMAMNVVDGRFQAIRSSWADEYLARVWDWHRSAVAVGATVGPALTGLMDQLEGLLPALQSVDRYCLVHGDLRPVNLSLEVLDPAEKDAPPEVDVLGIFDWEFAVMGDPLLGFALPLELPDDALACLLVGYGADTARAWLDDEAALMRLSAYSIGRAVQYLALAVASQIEGGGMPWGHGMAYAAALIAERRRADFVRDKLIRALPDELPVQVSVPDLGDPVRAVLRRAFGRLGGRPILGPSVLGAWLGSVGAALRDRDHEAEGWARDGELLLDALGPGIDLRGFEPIADRRAWVRSVDARMRGAEDGRVSGIWWLALEGLVVLSNAIDPTEWSVSDDVLRGLESFLEVMRAQPAAQGPREVLLYALLGLVSEERVGTLLGAPDLDRTRARHERLLEAWEDLTVFGGVQPKQMGADDFIGRELSLEGWVVPIVLFATSVARNLPVDRARIIGALCGSVAL